MLLRADYPPSTQPTTRPIKRSYRHRVYFSEVWQYNLWWSIMIILIIRVGPNWLFNSLSNPREKRSILKCLQKSWNSPLFIHLYFIFYNSKPSKIFSIYFIVRVVKMKIEYKSVLLCLIFHPVTTFYLLCRITGHGKSWPSHAIFPWESL